MAAGSVDTIDIKPWRSPVHWLILGGILLIAGIVIGTAAMTINFRDRALSSGERELNNTVLLLARHFDQQLEDLQVLQKEIITDIDAAAAAAHEDVGRRLPGRETHLLLKAKVSGSSDVGGVNIFDADGVLVNSSDTWPVQPVSIADRAYFKAFKSGTETSPMLAELVQSRRFPGSWTTVMSRKIEGPSGEFLGVVTRGISPDTIEKFFASVALGEGAAISMFHNDGTLLARYPQVDNMLGWNFRTGAVPKFEQWNPNSGTLRLSSPLDGQHRIAAVRHLSKFPLLIVGSTTVSAALADWRAQTRFLVAAATLAALVIAAMLLLIVRQVARQHRAAGRQLAREKQRLDTAVNNMTQGLLLFDAGGRLIVCNQRYLDMFALSRDVIKPGCTLRDLIAHRKETGSFAEDIDEYCASFRGKMALGQPTQSIYDTGDGRAIQFVYQPLADGGWVTTLEDITERRRSEERIAHLAHYDALTDLPNRVLFRERLERELAGLDGTAQCAVLYIDIDEFKSINDSLGHPIGDELLKTLASRLRGCVKEGDFVARLGGDEFAIIQTAVSDRSSVMELVNCLHQAIRWPCECQGHQISTDASIGIAMAPRDGADLDQLLKHADLAMYGAKADGRRTHRFFEAEMDARVKTRQQLEQDLRQIITGRGYADGGFEIHYQPLVCLQSNAITGCEALLRWRHPVRGMISPAEFIPVAEETGLISQLGEWVLSTACLEAASWPGDIKLAVNVSPVQFRNHTLALNVAAALAASGLSAGRLELEITEAVLIRDDDAALAILHQVRAIGVRIALDDFGTGYSSLSYLQRFPFDKIKIDRSFVKGIAEPGGSPCIVQAVVNIATARNMTTTAEGVETTEQRDLLRTLGCNEMQGWLFSAAKPAVDIRAMLYSRRDKAVA
jgi:diguanylate cyclase (GGDEF)-like protein